MRALYKTRTPVVPSTSETAVKSERFSIIILSYVDDDSHVALMSLEKYTGSPEGWKIGIW